MGFSVPFDRVALRVKAELDDKVRTKTVALFTRIINRTPVFTGCARANWNVSIGQPNFSFDRNERSINRALAEVTKVYSYPSGSVAYLSNGAPYIRLLEYGGYPTPRKPTGRTVGGYSSQAPAGMVRVSIAELGI